MAFNAADALVFLALSVMQSRDPKSPIPELLYVLSNEQLVTLIRLFSGTTVHFPTVEDYRKNLLTALYIYHRIVEGKKNDWFRKRYGVKASAWRTVKARFEQWKESDQFSDLGAAYGAGGGAQPPGTDSPIPTIPDPIPESTPDLPAPPGPEIGATNHD